MDTQWFALGFAWGIVSLGVVVFFWGLLTDREQTK